MCSIIPFFLLYNFKIMTTQEPSVITLDNQNSIRILSQYVELAQQKGAYLLNEAEILKRAIDLLVNNVPDREINENLAKNLLIQGVNKGQKEGCYTLNDASLLCKVVQFVGTSLQSAASRQETVQESVQETVQESVQESVQEMSDDLSDLADPIPLKPKEV